MADEIIVKKRITEYDAVNEIKDEDVLFLDSPSSGTKKLSGAVLRNALDSKVTGFFNFYQESAESRFLDSAYSYAAVSSTGAEGLLRNDNTVYEGAGYRASRSVTKGEVYAVSGRKFESDEVSGFYLRKNGSIVHRFTFEPGYFDDVVVGIPSGVDEIVVNLNSSLGVSRALKLGTKETINGIKTELTELRTDVDDVAKAQHSMIGTETDTEDITGVCQRLSGVMNAVGGITVDGTSWRTEVLVTPGDIHTITGWQLSSWFPLAVFLNGSTVVSVVDAEKTGTISAYSVKVPDGANKLVINGNTSAIIDVSSVKYAKQEWDWDIYPGATSAGVINTDGGTIETGNHMTVPVIAGERYRISGKSWNAYTPGYIFADNLSGLVIDSGITDGSYYTDYEITVPNNANVLYINGNAVVGLKCKKHKRISLAYRTKTLRKKTMVWFGTSIPQNSVYFDGANWSIPSYAGNILGMNVINECYGASIAARGVYNAITVDDPYGWTGVSWYAVFRALGASISEKNDLINNYQSKWYNLLGGSTDPLYVNSKPQTLTDALKAEILSCSYERRLMPYLNGTKPMPDLFVFEHGYNDSQATVFSGISPNEANLNMSRYSDAMYFYFKKIFEANPQAKILVVSHYENSSATGKKTFAAQKELAEYHGVFFCDVANKLGWTQRLVTTTGYWSNGVWIPSGGTERTITRLEQCIPDQVHPHTDASGSAVKREAQVIADYIASSINLD